MRRSWSARGRSFTLAISTLIASAPERWWASTHLAVTICPVLIPKPVVATTCCCLCRPKFPPRRLAPLRARRLRNRQWAELLLRRGPAAFRAEWLCLADDELENG